MTPPTLGRGRGCSGPTGAQSEGRWEDLQWVPQCRACPCPQHPKHHWWHTRVSPRTQAGDRVTHVPTHRHIKQGAGHASPQTHGIEGVSHMSSHIFPHPPQCSLPQFPQLSSPVPTRVPEGHHHCGCPRAPTCPGVAPAPPHAPKGPPVLGTHPRAHLSVPYPAPTAPQSPGTAGDTSAPLGCPHPCPSPAGRPGGGGRWPGRGGRWQRCRGVFLERVVLFPIM